MKKLLSMFVLFLGLISFNACTPETADDAGNEEIETQAVDPDDDGTVEDIDPDDDGEG
jgi:hypothetical protein